MATTPEKPTEAFNEKEFTTSLDKARSYFKPFSGKKGQNPHFRLNELDALEKRYKNGERTVALNNALKAIKLEEPTVGKVVDNKYNYEASASGVPIGKGTDAPPIKIPAANVEPNIEVPTPVAEEHDKTYVQAPAPKDGNRPPSLHTSDGVKPPQ